MLAVNQTRKPTSITDIAKESVGRRCYIKYYGTGKVVGLNNTTTFCTPGKTHPVIVLLDTHELRLCRLEDLLVM